MLEEESKRLHKQRDQMTGFWNKVQTITDIWVNRTAPRLDLLKEIHVRLESIREVDELCDMLRETNSRIEMLDRYLPRLELWQEGGKLSNRAKKAFCRTVRRCYERHTNLPDVLKAVGQVYTEDMKQMLQTFNPKLQEPEQEEQKSRSPRGAPLSATKSEKGKMAKPPESQVMVGKKSTMKKR